MGKQKSVVRECEDCGVGVIDLSRCDKRFTAYVNAPNWCEDCDTDIRYIGDPDCAYCEDCGQKGRGDI